MGFMSGAGFEFSLWQARMMVEWVIKSTKAVRKADTRFRAMAVAVAGA